MVAIADESSDNGSSIEMYTEERFILWMAEATARLATGEYEDICEAVSNTRPEPDTADSH